MRRLLRGTRTLREPVPRALGAQQGPSQEEGAETHSTGASKPNMYFNYMYVCSGAQSCLIVCDLMDCSLPGSSVHGISQARKLQWVAISYSRGSSQPRK